MLGGPGCVAARVCFGKVLDTGNKKSSHRSGSSVPVPEKKSKQMRVSRRPPVWQVSHKFTLQSPGSAASLAGSDELAPPWPPDFWGGFWGSHPYKLPTTCIHSRLCLDIVRTSIPTAFPPPVRPPPPTSPPTVANRKPLPSQVSPSTSTQNQIQTASATHCQKDIPRQILFWRTL